MKKKTTVILVAVLALVLVGASLLYRNLSNTMKPKIAIVPSESSTQTEEPSPQKQGSEQSEPESISAPDFAVTDADGNSVQLSDLQGKPVVLNFWASWCPPCKQEMPHFDKVWKEVGEEVEFMMVDLTDNRRETQETGSAFIEKMGYSFPVYYDLDQEAGDVYGVTSIPTTFFIDAEGVVVAGVQGAIPEESLREGIALISKAKE